MNLLNFLEVWLAASDWLLAIRNPKVKQTLGSSVRVTISRINNHPDRKSIFRMRFAGDYTPHQQSPGH